MELKIKLILLTAFFLLLLQPSTAYAHEEPVAGISTSLTATEQSPINYAIAYNSAINHLDSDLVIALLDKESEGKIFAVNQNRNGTTDYGLMQINSCNHEWLSEELGITDFYDPRQNIQAGCYMLGLLSNKYDNIHQILMSYNMGETQTRKLWSQGIYSSRYSREVVNKYNKLKGGF